MPCNNAMGNCEDTTWLFRDSRESTAMLTEGGQIHKGAKAKSDRLSVTDTCSLGIKKVTEEDAGQYFCRKYNRSGEQRTYQDSGVYLSVVNSEYLHHSVFKLSLLNNTLKHYNHYYYSD